MKLQPSPSFDPNCTRCPRLGHFLADVRAQYPDYHARPVAPFGDVDAGLLVVGLAPGMHGANATGRPFTGDHAGILLFRTLYDAGFSNQPGAASIGDGLQLKNCRITNAVKCLPPQNKPIGAEISTCNRYLKKELVGLRSGAVVLALGTVAHGAVLRALGLKAKDYRFGHGKQYSIGTDQWLIDSYHCSRYNTQTRRLTEEMFRQVFAQVARLLK